MIDECFFLKIYPNLYENIYLNKNFFLDCNGRSKFFFSPFSYCELFCFLNSICNDINLVWSGFSSCLFIRNGGFHGVIISLKNIFNCFLIIKKEYRSILLNIGSSFSYYIFLNFFLTNYIKHDFPTYGTLGGKLFYSFDLFKDIFFLKITNVFFMNLKGKVLNFYLENYDFHDVFSILYQLFYYNKYCFVSFTFRFNFNCNVWLLNNYKEKFLFLVLNRNNQIQSIYDDYFLFFIFYSKNTYIKFNLENYYRCIVFLFFNKFNLKLRLPIKFIGFYS